MITKVLGLALLTATSFASQAATYNCTESFGAGEPDFELNVTSTAKHLVLKAEDVWLDVTLNNEDLTFVKEQWKGRTLEKLVFTTERDLDWKVSKSIVAGGRSGTVSYEGFDAGSFFRAFKCTRK